MGKHSKGCLGTLVRAALAVGLAVALGAAKCEAGDGQDETPSAPITVDVPVRKGDTCRVNGAVGTTTSGERVVCSRHRGLDYDTWDVG